MPEKSTITLSCDVTKGVFEKDGTSFPYFTFSIDLDGTKINLQPKPEDKKLSNHLLKELFEL